MPANVQNAKDFLFTTDFPIDQVIYLNSGSSFLSSSSGTITFPHNLPFTPLVSGSWALDPSFDVSYEYRSGTFPSDNATLSIFNTSLDITATSTDIIIGYVNYGAPLTVYYRVFGFEPSDSFADIAPTASSGDDFIINTDYNYTKLYMEGAIINPSFPGFQTVFHNLGYLPQVMIWETDTLGFRRPLDFLDLPGFSNVAAVVTATALDFILPAFTLVRRLDYRIYLDDNA